LTQLDEKLVARVLQEYKIYNCDILFKEDCSVDDLIDIIEVMGEQMGGVEVMVECAFGGHGGRG
jgi:ribosome-interacting GTPase 1